uniref:DUF4460 domain-containing protein n=1 Tax=Meloidogyne hapla TaxID=6305 RepID=A0A1I8BW31_MELHA
MCPNTLRFLRKFPNVCVTQHYLFSAKEAAIALRPFYFAVHPDRLALERCELSTDHLPVRDKHSRHQKSGVRVKTSPQKFSPGLDEIWKNLQESERLRQKRFYSFNLLKELSKNRELAMQRRDGHKIMVEMIDDNIAEIKRKTGVTQILWSINW